MPHINIAPNGHDLTVSAFVIRTDLGNEPRFLLHLHRKHGILLPIGGHVETTENPWQAIKHELSEESGYDLDTLSILQPKPRIESLSKVLLHPYPLNINTHDISRQHFHTDISYAFVAMSAPGKAPSTGESSDLRWLTLDQIEQIPADQIPKNTVETVRFISDHALASWELVSTTDYSLDFQIDWFRSNT